MIIALIGASGSGKSTIEKELSKKYNYKKIISHTTRSPRSDEIDGQDYHFVSNETFNAMLRNNLIAEHDEYSQNRLYGTIKADYLDNTTNKVVVLTPNGLRQLKKNGLAPYIFSVLVQANLGTRIKRYIDRCGVDKFNFDDKNEIAARVERDFGAFLGVENEVNLVVHNDEDANVKDIVEIIMSNINVTEG